MVRVTFVPGAGAGTGGSRVPRYRSQGHRLPHGRRRQNPVKGNSTWGIPARTVVQVSDGTPVLGQAVGQSNVVRPDTLLTGNSISGGTIAVVALGAGGVTMFMVGVALAFTAVARRRSAPRW